MINPKQKRNLFDMPNWVAHDKILTNSVSLRWDSNTGTHFISNMKNINMNYRWARTSRQCINHETNTSWAEQMFVFCCINAMNWSDPTEPKVVEPKSHRKLVFLTKQEAKVLFKLSNNLLTSLHSKFMYVSLQKSINKQISVRLRCLLTYRITLCS